MKKMTLVAVLTAGVFVAQAQTTFGVHAAGIMANQTAKSGDTELDNKSRFGWKVGGVANMPIASNIAFMPQLNVVNKGSEIKMDIPMFGTIEGTTSLTYVELPLNFVYTSGGFFGGIGPSIAFGIGGKETYKSGGTEEETDVKFDGKEDATDDKSHYKGLDFGAQVIAGYKLPSGLFFNVHYNHGFSNIAVEDNVEIKNSYFGFGVGFMFGGSGDAKK